MSTASTPDAASAPAEPRRAYLDLFLVSFVILFFELACIRWYGSTVVFMTFFTNVVLLACFLGMSVGCLAAARRIDLIRFVLPLSAFSLAAGYFTLWSYWHFGRLLIDVGGQGSPQQIFFGTEYRANDPGQFVVPIEIVAGFFFVLISLIFLGLGQVMGRAFNAIPNRVLAYTTNVAASLLGIIAFGILSLLHSPPAIWFGISAAIVLWFIPSRSMVQMLSALGIVTILAFAAADEAASYVTIWSPYYKVYYDPLDGRITTNNIGHQQMTRVGETGSAYMLPHLLNRDAGNAPFAQTMIIGAGSGNDVAAALAGKAEHIDAVEIEPVLNAIGRDHHPLRPYADPRVAIHLDDGRSFVRKAGNQYDLIEYALVDSLVLHSGYGSLRLESFLFTEQAFRDVKARLKPDGVFAMYNYYRQGWIVGRLEKMAENVFGTKPIVVSLPYTDAIEPGESLRGGFTFVIVGPSGSRRLEAIRAAFEKEGNFWLNLRPLENVPINGFSAERPAVPGVSRNRWERIALARVNTTGIDLLPTDDWPFLYLRSATIPGLNLRGMALIALLSLIILGAVTPVRRFRPNGQMFFLGAGFMLLETKGVIHMALLFGATWVVNSIVFSAILVMILLSNLCVLAMQPRRLWPYYVLLIAALLVNVYVPMSTFLDLPGAAQVVTSCLVVFVPVFFAGVIFAAAFRDSAHPDRDFGSNIGGVILGGLSENLSLVVGFKNLLLLAIAYYALSAVLGPRRQSVSAKIPMQSPV